VSSFNEQTLIQEFAEKANLDLSSFSEEFIFKRVISFCNNNSIKPNELIDKIRLDSVLTESFITSLSVLVSDFFRDPDFYSELEAKVLEWLRTFPMINIWSIGCATGEEPYSIAIWLKRNGLLNRTTIYATDISSSALEIAKSANYSKLSIDRGAQNYFDYCGRDNFLNYFSDNGEIIQEIKDRVTFHNHNCIYDGAFCRAQLVFCRNLLIYYNEEAQFKILQLIKSSLDKKAFLCLGKVEHVPFDWRKSLNLERIECEGKVYRSY